MDSSMSCQTSSFGFFQDAAHGSRCACMSRDEDDLPMFLSCSKG